MTNPLDELARQNPQAIEELRQHARELAAETDSFEEFAEMFGFGSVCERCGRRDLDDEDYTDCDVVPGEGPEAPDILLCHACIAEVAQ